MRADFSTHTHFFATLNTESNFGTCNKPIECRSPPRPENESGEVSVSPKIQRQSFSSDSTKIRRDVRHLHQRLYFRPILDSLVGLPAAQLDREEAALRSRSSGISRCDRGLEGRRGHDGRFESPISSDAAGLAADARLAFTITRPRILGSTSFESCWHTHPITASWSDCSRATLSQASVSVFCWEPVDCLVS